MNSVLPQAQTHSQTQNQTQAQVESQNNQTQQDSQSEIAQLRRVVEKQQATIDELVRRFLKDAEKQKAYNRAVNNTILACNNNVESTRAINTRVTSVSPSPQTSQNTLNILNSTVNDSGANEMLNSSDSQNLSISELNQTLKNFNNSFEKSANPRIFFKTHYKLTKKTSIKTWLDYLNSELMTHDLLDIIDDTVQPIRQFSSEEKNKRIIQVRNILINRIDDYYHKNILNIKNPVEIIEKIREIRKSEANLSASNVRAKLYLLRKQKSAGIMAFYDKFDAVCQESRVGEDIVPLSDEEKRS